MADVAVSSAVDAAKIIVNQLIKTISDYRSVIPEGIAFCEQCDYLQKIIEPLIINEKRLDLYIRKILDCTVCHEREMHNDVKNGIIPKYSILLASVFLEIQKIKAEVTKLVEENNRKKALLGETAHKIWKVWHAKKYRLFFSKETASFKDKIADLTAAVSYSEAASNFNVSHVFKDDVPKQANKFWVANFTSSSIEVDWNIFMAAYESHIGEKLNENNVKSVEVILCIDKKVSCYAFGSGTVEYDFPFDTSRLPQPPDYTSQLSQDGRLQLVGHVMQLMKEYSLSKNIITSIVYYFKNEEGEDLAEDEKHKKCEEWAQLVHEVNTKHEKSSKHKEAVNIEHARSRWSFLYQRYMVLWRVGQLSHDLFTDIDFPGRSRIKQFMSLVEPLDRANYLYVIKGSPDLWPGRKPKVYAFLEEIIKK